MLLGGRRGGTEASPSCQSAAGPPAGPPVPDGLPVKLDIKRNLQRVWEQRGFALAHVPFPFSWVPGPALSSPWPACRGPVFQGSGARQARGSRWGDEPPGVQSGLPPRAPGVQRSPFRHFSRYSAARCTFLHSFLCASICEHRLRDCPTELARTPVPWDPFCCRAVGADRTGCRLPRAGGKGEGPVGPWEGRVLRACAGRLQGWVEGSQPGLRRCSGEGAVEVGEKPDSSRTGRWCCRVSCGASRPCREGRRAGCRRECQCCVTACAAGACDCSSVASVLRGHRGAGSCGRCAWRRRRKLRVALGASKAQVDVN